ncbi:rhodanese-like domain-containing protein [Rufibacter soli]
MKRIVFSLAATALLTSCNTQPTKGTTPDVGTEHASVPQQTHQVKPLSSQEVKDLLAGESEVVVLDVRTPSEFKAGHLKNAQLLDIYSPDFQGRLKALNPEKTYLVYCAVGGRSSQASERMKQLGFKQIYDAREGFSSLKEMGIALE